MVVMRSTALFIVAILSMEGSLYVVQSLVIGSDGGVAAG